MAGTLFAFLPLTLCWLLGAFLGRLGYWLLPRHRRRVFGNLLRALGEEMGKRECRRIARRFFAAWGRNVLCGWKLSRMRQSSVEKRVRYENRQAALEAVEEGRGVIAAIPRMGPAHLALRISLFGPGVERALLGRPPRNPDVRRRFQRTLRRDHVGIYVLGTELYGPMEHLRKGGGLVVDLDEHPRDDAVHCPLFGRLTPGTNLPALVALRTGAALVPVTVYPDGVARWKLVYGDPVRMKPEARESRRSTDITAELFRAIEEMIRRSPEEWFWLHDRWDPPTSGFLFPATGTPVFEPPADEEKFWKPFRILVRSPNWLGDACMAVPAVRALKNGRPDAEVTVLCNDNLRDLWEGVRHVDDVLIKARKASPLKVGRTLAREGPWDAGILFPNSPRSALEMKLGGVRPVLGYAGRGRSVLLDERLAEARRPGPPGHHADRYMRIAQRAGADGIDGAFFAAQSRPREAGERRRVGLCPGAAYGGAKRWPVQRFVRAVEELDAQWPGTLDWIVYGAPKEAEIARRLERECAVRVENRVGKTTLGELIEDLQRLDTLITNDTGTMHLAALLGVRTVAIFGSTEPALTAPLGPGHEVLRVHVDCSPCFLRECPRDFRCMNAVEVADVVAAAKHILQGTSKNPRGRAG